MRDTQALVGFAVVGMLVPGLAHAQSATPLGTVSDSKVWIGGHLGLSPIGSLEASASGGGNSVSASVDAAAAFEIGGLIEYRVTPNISIGFTPTVLLNVKGTDDKDSATALDLPLRLSAGANVAPRVRLYGFAAPGYSILFPPSDAQGNTTHPSGFMLGFGGGVGYRVAPKFMLAGELGYQFRFLSTSEQGVDISLHVNYLTFAVTAVAAID